MLKIIVSDISNYMGIYFGRSLLLGGIGAIVLLIIFLLVKKFQLYNGSYTRIAEKTIAMFLGIVYGYMVVGITFLCREPIFEKTISFVPFSAPLGNPRLWAYFFENIMMFVPYGIIIPILSSYMERWYSCLVLGICSSILIECSQYVTSRGKAQIDDVLLNSAGMLIGWIIFRLISKAHKKRLEKKEN